MKGKKLAVPHSLVVIFIILVLASLLTYVVRPGTYERYKTDAGVTMVDPDSFQYVERTPVNPISVLAKIYKGMTNASSMVFCVLLCGGGLGIVLKTGVLQAAAATMGRKLKGKEWVVIAALMTIFAALCIPINMTILIPLAPLALVISQALGLDAIVGVSCIMLGGAVGFSCGAMNVSNTGTAQMIAELPILSGMGYRLICMIPFLISAIWFVCHYAKKIQKDPTKSYVYGVELETQYSLDDVPEFTKKHIPVAVVVAIGIGYMVYAGIKGTLNSDTVSSAFIYMGVLAGFAYGMKPNEVAKSFVSGVKDAAGTGAMLGFAYAISVVLTSGNIMDTVVHSLASMLSYVPDILKAPAMLVMHTLINVFITSGSGQAAASMPIMVPVADLIGMTRQTAVLAFNFGDGFCNNILPHAAATMGFVGLAGIPFGRWFRYAIKLFLIWFVIGCILLMIATAIGYA